jgi:hypothetical protein
MPKGPRSEKRVLYAIIGSQLSARWSGLFADVQFLALKRRWVGVSEIPDGHRWDSSPKNQVRTRLHIGERWIRNLGSGREGLRF